MHKTNQCPGDKSSQMEMSLLNVKCQYRTNTNIKTDAQQVYDVVMCITNATRCNNTEGFECENES